MNARLYRLSDGSSDKWWAIANTPQGLMTFWGKVGSDLKFQQSKPVTNGKDMWKLISEKERKGYDYQDEININSDLVFSFGAVNTPPPTPEPEPTPKEEGYSVFFEISGSPEIDEATVKLIEGLKHITMPTNPLPSSGEIKPHQLGDLLLLLHLRANGANITIFDSDEIEVGEKLHLETRLLEEFNLDLNENREVFLELGIVKKSIMDLDIPAKESTPVNSAWF